MRTCFTFPITWQERVFWGKMFIFVFFFFIIFFAVMSFFTKLNVLHVSWLAIYGNSQTINSRETYPQIYLHYKRNQQFHVSISPVCKVGYLKIYIENGRFISSPSYLHVTGGNQLCFARAWLYPCARIWELRVLFYSSQWHKGICQPSTIED